MHQIKINTIQLAWALPVAYVIHLLEEYFAGEGMPVWFSDNLIATLSNKDFLIINAVGLTVVTLFSLAYTFRKENNLLLLAFGILFLVNGIIHPLASLLTRSYAPGTISGMIIYIPLGILIFNKTKPLLTPIGRVIGITIGITLHALVSFIALNI